MPFSDVIGEDLVIPWIIGGETVTPPGEEGHEEGGGPPVAFARPEEDEIRKAMAYRRQWASRISFRANQLRAMAGQPTAFEDLWTKYRKIYDPTMYIPGEEIDEFFTPFDVDDAGGRSRSHIELANTKQSRRREPA